MEILKKIPDNNAWKGYKDDLDVKYFYDFAYGKSIDEIQNRFGEGTSIERADELLFSPRVVFQFYIQAFVNYIMSEKAKGDSDSASSFIHLLLSREEKDPGSVKNIYQSLAETIDFIENNQEYYKADLGIYGNFADLCKEIKRRCGVKEKL